jgi:tetratricopeptide (TPR) repeat protein
VRRLFIIVLFFTMASYAWGDVVHLKSGKILQGNIIDETDLTIRIETRSKVWILKKNLIEKVERGSHSALPKQPPDAAGQDLATAPDESSNDEQLAHDDPQAAIVYWEAVIEDNPQQHEAYTQIGLAYNHLQQPNQAIPYFQKAIALNPVDAENYNNMAYTFMMLEQFEQAEKYIKLALKIRPHFTEAIGNYGFITLGLKRYLEAINLFKVAIAATPNNHAYHENIAFAYKQISDSKNAETHLLKAKKIYQEAGNFDAMRVMDYELSQLKNVSQPEPQALSSVTRPLGPSFDGRVWEIGFRKEQPDSRITEYVLMGESVDDWSELVTINEFLGLQKELNAKEFRQAIRSNLEKICRDVEWVDINATFHDVLYRFNARECDEQEDVYEVARIILTTDRIYTMHYASKKMLITDQVDKWSQILTETLFSGTEAFDAFTKKDKPSSEKKKDTLDMGVKLLEQNEYDSAIIFFKSLLLDDPNNIDVLYFLARAYLETDAVEEAQTLLLRANNLSPYEPDVNVMLAETYVEMGQLSQARDYFRKARSLYAELGIDDVVQEIDDLLQAIDPQEIKKSKNKSFVQVLRRSRQEGDGLWLVILVGPAFFLLYVLDLLIGVRLRRRFLKARQRKRLLKFSPRFDAKIKDITGQPNSMALYYYQDDFRVDIQSIFRRPKSRFSSTAGYYESFLSVQTNTDYCLVCIPSVGKDFAGRRMNVLSMKALKKSRNLTEIRKETMPSFCQLFKKILTNDEAITRRIFQVEAMRSLMFEKATMLVEIDKGAVIVPLDIPFRKADKSVIEISTALERLFPIAKVISE